MFGKQGRIFTFFCLCFRDHRSAKDRPGSTNCLWLHPSILPSKGRVNSRCERKTLPERRWSESDNGVAWGRCGLDFWGTFLDFLYCLTPYEDVGMTDCFCTSLRASQLKRRKGYWITLGSNGNSVWMYLQSRFNFLNGIFEEYQ